MEEWMRALTCAGYDYMRKAVSDLQRQLNELNASARLNRQDNQTATFHPGSAANHNLVAGAGSRINPFNQDLETTEEVFPSSSSQQDARPIRARTFEEMHLDIGEQIRLATMKQSKDLHLET